MNAQAAQEMFRPGLLGGLAIAVAGASAAGIATARACAALGAQVTLLHAETDDPRGGAGSDVACTAVDARDEPAVGAAVAAAARAAGGSLDMLVADAGARFGAGGQDGLRAGIDAGWLAARAAATESMIAARRGKVVLLAPARRSGTYAGALAAAVENLARTLSIEWSQYGILTTAVVAAEPQRAAALVAYLASPAGDFASGCVFDLAGASD